MGIAVTKQTELNSNEFVLKFIGKEFISPNDPFWNSFLTFNITVPQTSTEQLFLETKIEPLLQQLISNNPQTKNISSLIQVFLIRASELLAATTTDNNLFSWQTLNALFIIRCILKYLTEMVPEEQLLQQVETGVDNNVVKLETLIGSLFGIVVDVPLKDATYAIHLEAITTILVLLSTEIHSNQRPEQSNIFRLIMKGRHSIHAPLFVRSLLQNFIEQKKQPPGDGHGSSIVLGLATEIWSILTFTRKPASSETIEGVEVESSPLGMHSLLLILVLANHCSIQPNPYRQCLFSCVNSQDNNPIGPTQETGVFRIEYTQLFNVLCKRASGDVATLLLYLLLHQNPGFKAHLLNRADLEQLVIPILKTLYHAPDSNSHHIYMSLIILLILSEDEGFNRSIHLSKLKNVSWYTERVLSEVSLGGLLVLVVIRTIQYNMLKMKDKYLHTNCLAALANMSSQFRDLHPYVCQRLVSLFETLAKRYQRFKAEMQLQDADNSVQIPIADEQDVPDAEQYMYVLEEVLRMVLEIFNSALTHQLHNNPNLVYTLLYKKDVFRQFKTNPAFSDIVHNIEIIIEYFSELLSSKMQHQEVDAHLVLNVICQGARHWPKDKLTKFPDLKFKYVEEEQPEEFFIPYIWALVNQQNMRLTALLAWRKASTEPVPFQERLPLKLKPTVSGKGDKTSEVCCIQEMSIMLACFKTYEFNQTLCSKEIDSFKNCYTNHMKAKRVKKEHAEKGILTPGERQMTFKQVNILLKRHPNHK